MSRGTFGLILQHLFFSSFPRKYTNLDDGKYVAARNADAVRTTAGTVWKMQTNLSTNVIEKKESSSIAHGIYNRKSRVSRNVFVNFARLEEKLVERWMAD